MPSAPLSIAELEHLHDELKLNYNNQNNNNNSNDNNNNNNENQDKMPTNREAINFFLYDDTESMAPPLPSMPIPNDPSNDDIDDIPDDLTVGTNTSTAYEFFFANPIQSTNIQ